MTTLEGVLLIAFLVRELIFHYQINKLIEKLMARNLHEYEMAKNVGRSAGKKDVVTSVREDDSDAEDLGVLNGLL